MTESPPARSSGRRKIVILTPFAERMSGSDSILWTYLQHSDREQVEHLVVFRGNGPFVRELDGIGIRTVVLPESRLRQLRHTVATIRRLAAIFKREQPALIVNWVTAAQLYGAPAAMLAGLGDRLTWWQLDVPTAPPSALGGVKARLATLLPAKAIGGCSEAVTASQATLWPHRPCFTVLPGIDAPARTPDEDLAELRTELGIPSDARVVGIVGRLFAWKGHHRLLRALASLRDDGYTVHGLFVGGGGYRGDPEYEQLLEDVAEALSLTDSVTFTGQVTDASPYLQLMDVFVNASENEPFGIAVLEAMALGVPVVAANAGGPAEILEDGVSGVLTPTSEAEALATGIRSLLEDASLRRRISKEGLARFAHRFTAEEMTQEMDRRLIGLCVTSPE